MLDGSKKVNAMKKFGTLLLGFLLLGVLKMYSATDNWPSIVGKRLEDYNHWLARGDYLNHEEIDESEFLATIDYLRAINSDPSLIDKDAIQVSGYHSIQAKHMALQIYAGARGESLISTQRLDYPMAHIWGVDENEKAIRSINNSMRIDWLEKVFHLKNVEEYILQDTTSRLPLINNYLGRLISSRDARLFEILCIVENSSIRESRSFWRKAEESLDPNRFGLRRDRSEALKLVNRNIVDQEQNTEAILNDDTCSYKNYFENAFQFLLREDHELIDELSELIGVDGIDGLKSELFEIELMEILGCALDFGLDFSKSHEDEDKEVSMTNRARDITVEYMSRNEDCFGEDIRDVLKKLRHRE